MQTLTSIPKHFGEGGSGLAPDGGAGNPTLRTLLHEHKTALEELQGSADVTPTHNVRAASTANIASLAAASTTMDGLTLVAGNRVLLKNQSTPSQNGIYVVGTVGGGSAPLTRATDFNVSGEAQPNVIVAVAEGTANADKHFQLTTDAPITLGSTSLTFAAIAAGLTSTAPSDIGTTAAAGTSVEPARADHVHRYPASQSGTVTLVAGTATIASANITATSRIFYTRTTAGSPSSTVHYGTTSKTPGAPGSFTVNAQVAAGTINIADTSTLDYVVVN
jgi:hypothetical protein